MCKMMCIPLVLHSFMRAFMGNIIIVRAYSLPDHVLESEGKAAHKADISPAQCRCISQRQSGQEDISKSEECKGRTRKNPEGQGLLALTLSNMDHLSLCGYLHCHGKPTCTLLLWRIYLL